MIFLFYQFIYDIFVAQSNKSIYNKNYDADTLYFNCNSNMPTCHCCMDLF
ncbi:unknown [Bacteroides eggerthii CAG:109]|nr:unknown [Bacteroides eggerthii CAG:109]